MNLEEPKDKLRITFSDLRKNNARRGITIGTGNVSPEDLPLISFSVYGHPEFYWSFSKSLFKMGVFAVLGPEALQTDMDFHLYQEMVAWYIAKLLEENPEGLKTVDASDVFITEAIKCFFENVEIVSSDEKE